MSAAPTRATVGATLARHVAIYGVSSVLVQSTGLFTAPVFTRHFGPARYGLLDVTGATVALLLTVALAGMDGAVARAYMGSPAEGERQTVVSTGLAAVAGLGTLVAVVAIALAEPVSGLVFGDRSHGDLVMAAAVGVPLTAAAGYTRRLLRLQSRPVLFLVAAVTVAGVGAVSAVVLAVPAGLGLPGVYLGLAVGAAVALVPGLAASRHLFRWRFSARTVVELAAVGVPLALFALSTWAIRMLDRFILVWAVDLDDLGLYAAANRVATVLLLAVVAFEGAWLPVLLRTEGTGDEQVAAARDRALPWFAAAMALLGAGLAAFSSEILRLVAGDRFVGAASVVPPLVLAMLFHATTPVTTSALIVARRTGGLAYGALGAVVVNVAACLVLIPTWGIQGAAWATVAAFAFRSVDARRRMARLAVPSAEGRRAQSRAARGLALAVPFLGLGYLDLANGLVDVVVKGGGVVGLGVLLVATGVVRR